MSDFVNLHRTARRCATVLALCAVWAQAPAQGATVLPALQRPALQVKAPERQVLQTAARAGGRVVAIGERGLIVLSDDQGKTWAPGSPGAGERLAHRAVLRGRAARLGRGPRRRGPAHRRRRRDLEPPGRRRGTSPGRLGRGRAAGGTAPRRSGRRASAGRCAPSGRGRARTNRCWDVRFADARRGWVVGAYNLFFETTDGGASWRSISTRLDKPEGAAPQRPGHGCRDRRCSSPASRACSFARSTPARPFQALASPYKGSWFSLAQGEDGAVTVAGLRGNAFRSADGGTTWTTNRRPAAGVYRRGIGPGRWLGGAVQPGRSPVRVAGRCAGPAAARGPHASAQRSALCSANRPRWRLGFGGAISLDLSGAGK